MSDAAAHPEFGKLLLDLRSRAPADPEGRARGTESCDNVPGSRRAAGRAFYAARSRVHPLSGAASAASPRLAAHKPGYILGGGSPGAQHANTNRNPRAHVHAAESRGIQRACSWEAFGAGSTRRCWEGDTGARARVNSPKESRGSSRNARALSRIPLSLIRGSGCRCHSAVE